MSRNSNTTEQTKKKMIRALKLYMGIVSRSCEHVSISRTTHYQYLKEDKAYRNEVQNIDEQALDFAESKLMELINGVDVSDGKVIYKRPPCKTSIIFYLKTKGKKRGYIERQDIKHYSNSEPITGITILP